MHVMGLDQSGNTQTIAVDECGRQITSNAPSKMRDAFEIFDTVERWNVVSQGANDIVQLDGNVASASYLVISIDPLAAGREIIVESRQRCKMPFRAGFGISISQRVAGFAHSVEIVSTDEDFGGLQLPAPVAISTMSQVSSTLTVTTATPHGLLPGQRIGISGAVDSRLNYPQLVVASITSATQFTTTAGPAGTIVSLSAGPVTSGSVYIRSTLGGGRNGTSINYEGTSATSASLYLRSEAGDALPSGTILGNHTVTIASSASVQLVNAKGAYSFTPTSVLECVSMLESIRWMDKSIDSSTANFSIRAKREQVVPDINETYKMRIRATAEPGATIPVAQVVTASKAGSTTATVTTDVPHGLATTDYVNIYGTADQTNFANLSTITQVASIVSATQFTIIWGASVTATTHGGYVSRANGNVAQPGAVAQAVQNVARTGNVLTLTGSGTWAGLVIGDYVNVLGCRLTSDGSTVGVDGVYRVNNMATTALTLEPCNAISPVGDNIGSVAAGGGVIKRTDIRLSFIRAMEMSRMIVESYGGLSTSDQGMATPVQVVSSASIGINGTATVGGVAAHDAAVGGSPVRVGARGVSANYAAVSTGDTTDLITTLVGALVVKDFSIPELDWSYAAAASGIVNTTTAVDVRAAQAAGIRNYITGVHIMAEALGTATEFTISDGTTPTVLFRLKIGTAGIPQGVNIVFPTPLKTAAAAKVSIATLTASGTGAVYCNLQGYSAP